MARKSKSRSTKRHSTGTVPGHLHADPHAHPTHIRVIAYGPDELIDQEVTDIADVTRLRDRFPVIWIDVTGLRDVAAIEALGALFALHPLSLEDVLHVNQRAKVESYDNYLFVVTRMFSTTDPRDSEQISMFIGARGVLTFQEKPRDCLDPVRKRLFEARPRIRSAGPDYLAYAILDAIIDAYFPVVETLGEYVEGLERRTLEDPGTEILGRIHELKRVLMELRRAAWPQRDAIAALTREDNPLITRETQVFLRDCHDHSIRLMDLIESHREVATSLVELYMSSLSQRMNEVMKVLTIIATIFIPLSFIAGVYGMNFDSSRSPWNMPELGWYFGYPAALALMAAVGGALVVWFRRKGWL